ncbi:chemotaxis protein CheW [Desulfococcaceae bacterium HSG8]|nr:chemotaxis protein CheW [Desulfococcaceae bacterium HSG8]
MANDRKELLIFQVGNRQLGLDLSLVRSIHGANALSEEEMLFEEVVRESHLQQAEGKIPLYDLSAILGETPLSHTAKKVMLLKVQDHSLALKVDHVNRVVSAGNDQIEPLSPIFRERSRCCFPHVLKQEDHLILLLNPEGIEQTAFSPVTEEEPGVQTRAFDPEELEDLLTRMAQEDMMSEMIVRVSARVIEEAVARKMGEVEKIFRKRMEEGRTHGRKQ